MGIAAMVCGILATLLGLNPAFFLGALPLGVIALVLGIVAYKSGKSQGQPTGTAMAGIVLGSTGIAFSVLMWLMCHMLVSGAKSAVENNIAAPLKKMVAEAEAKMKAERDPGLPLDRARAIKVTAIKLTQELDENGAAAEKRYNGRTVEVTGEIASIDKHWGNQEYYDIEIVGHEVEAEGEEEPYTEDVTCKLVKADSARALTLKTGQQITVIGVADTTIAADLRGCVIK
jgi:hypothetical protein